MPHCNTDNFQVFLDELSKHNQDEFKIMVLDNGAFHKSKELKVPQNIGLIFTPPYSPELNPAEKMWQNYKSKFTNKFYKTLDEVSDFITQHTKNITDEIVKSTCAFSYIFETIKWTD